MALPSTQMRACARVRLVALLNLGYFGIEFAVAARDRLGVAVRRQHRFPRRCLGQSADRGRARAGRRAAARGSAWRWPRILLVPGLATHLDRLAKFMAPSAPAPMPLSATGLGALVVNLSCASCWRSYRHHSGSLTRAAFLSARNDALANVAIIAAGLVTALLWRSVWPDLIVGLGIRR